MKNSMDIKKFQELLSLREDSVGLLKALFGLVEIDGDLGLDNRESIFRPLGSWSGWSW